MKKFIVPIINLVSLILASVVFGLGSTTAVKFGPSEIASGNWYQLVWEIPQALKAVAVMGFFFFCVAVFLALVTMIPFKFRFVGVCLAGLLFVATGVMFLLTPAAVYSGSNAALYSKTDSYIAMIVLVFVAGGLELLATAVSLLPEKK